MSLKGMTLVVSGDLGTLKRWTNWLGQEGYATMVCSGPEATRGCPREFGEPCMAREAAEVTVLDARAETGPSAVERLCTTFDGDERTIVVDESAGTMRVGSAKLRFDGSLDPDTLTSAVDGLLER